MFRFVRNREVSVTRGSTVTHLTGNVKSNVNLHFDAPLIKSCLMS